MFPMVIDGPLLPLIILAVFGGILVALINLVGSAEEYWWVVVIVLLVIYALGVLGTNGNWFWPTDIVLVLLGAIGIGYGPPLR